MAQTFQLTNCARKVGEKENSILLPDPVCLYAAVIRAGDDDLDRVISSGYQLIGVISTHHQKLGRLVYYTAVYALTAGSCVYRTDIACQHTSL